VRAGVASRREADRLIAAGHVLVDGRRPPASGQLVDPERARVSVGGRDVAPPKEHRHLVLHKPVGVLVTEADPRHRPTVFDLLAAHGETRRVFAVGRLDYDTAGLLLLTDDGELSQRLMRPRYSVPKEYLAVVGGTPDDRDLRRLREGVELEDGRTRPATAEIVGRVPAGAVVKLVITEGRNRQVRRMLDAVGHPVRELTRTAFGPVRLGRLRTGDVRKVREPELEALRRAVKLA
jgi:23S rRNA pseudouridine2605 synthase